MILLIDSRPIFLKMYFLTKFCRICVQSGVQLMDIASVDFDGIRLSEKLEVCTRMVVNSESVSSEICMKCVNKLRVSYHFQDMCKKSTKIIQRYVAKLIGQNSKMEQENFFNSELNVVVTAIPDIEIEHLQTTNINVFHSGLHKSKRKQRITKEQRCSILKQLLAPGHKPKKERDKLIFCSNTFNYEKGGLKKIIDFTTNYEFSFNLDKNSNIESTPLDKLTAFSANYFKRDFAEFKDNILYIIENRDNFGCNVYSSDEESDHMSGSETDDAEEMLDNSTFGMFEEVIVEPDIKIKSEDMECEEEEGQCPFDYVETSYDELCIKKEEPQSGSEEEESSSKNYHFPLIDSLKPLIHTSTNLNLTKTLENCSTSKSYDHNSSVQIFNYSQSSQEPTSVKLLDKLVASYPLGCRKIFSPSNVRCRTRNNPYINPMLKDQFLFRSFKCERCNRYFKSQGYLKAHTSKVH